MKRPQFVNGEIYHIFNRGVEKRNIFEDEKDYFRFIHDLFEFNDSAPAGKFSQGRPAEVGPRKIARKPVIEILCFCLMPNHFHLIVRQLVDNGIPFFMKKLGTGYAMHFNKQYQRVGGLFQGRFKAVIVENEDYLKYLSCYVHLNPVELIEKNWKEKGINDWVEINKFLESYRWSSYLDYIGKQNFPSITSRDFLGQLFYDSANHRRFVNELLIKDLDKINNLFLE